ncbi:MAG: arylsulfatase [Planctomycetota bacterium]
MPLRILSCLLFLAGSSALVFAEDRPNVIVIMADDLGFGDVSCYGATALETPHIDRLARGGLRFTSGYCSASTCTPTRYSFLTGEYAFRREGTGIAPPNAPAIISAGTPTIASLFRDSGYRTAVVGKWHLGLGDESGPDWNGELKPGPLEIGFEQCFLLPTTNDRVPQVYVQDHRVLNLDSADPLWVGNKKPSDDHPTGITHRDTLKMDWSHGHNQTIHNGISRIGFYTGGESARFRDEDLSDKWGEQAEKFIRKVDDRPFFLFFASHDIHVPRMPHERFQGSTKLGPRGDAIAELDDSVGRLFKTLTELAMLENTIIVFCSDNGPVMDDGYADDALEKVGDHRAAGPYTGGKYSVYEGGTRTPFIIHWPKRVDPGTSDEVVCTIDLARSLGKLIDANVPSAQFIDSKDVSGALIGEWGSSGRKELVQQDNGKDGTYGFRSGQWKLHRYDRGKARNLVVETKLANTKVPKYQLFDLDLDPDESQNVIDQFPDVAEAMKKRLQEIIDANSES